MAKSWLSSELRIKLNHKETGDQTNMTETGSSSSNSANSSPTNKGCQPSTSASYASSLRMTIIKSFLTCYESEEGRESNPKGKKEKVTLEVRLLE